MNRRGFLKTVFGGLGLALLAPLLPPAKPKLTTQGQGQGQGTRKADFPSSHEAVWADEELEDSVKIYCWNDNQWRPLGWID